MPYLAHTRNVLALPSWRHPRQERQSSTTQESSSLQDGERTSAMLHGKRRSPGFVGKRSTSKDTSDVRVSHAHSAIWQKDAKSQTVEAVNPPESASSSSRRQRVHPPVKLAPPGSSRKRKADNHISQRPARRRRGGKDAAHLELKDEAYIRKTMRIPVPEDYPELPAKLFKHIKASIHDASQGIADIESDVKMLTNEVFQTTLRYKSTVYNEVVIGEGRSKVRYLIPQFSNLLIITRWLPPMQLICI